MAYIGTTPYTLKRNGITAADGADLTAAAFVNNLRESGQSDVFEIDAVCTTTGQTLTLAVGLYDKAGVPFGVTETLTFTSTALTGAGGAFLCVSQFVDSRLAQQFVPVIQSVSGGTWTVTVRPSGAFMDLG